MDGVSYRLALSAVASLVLAGCFSSGPASLSTPTQPPDVVSFDPDWAERAVPYGQDHSHTDAAQHQGLSTPNFDVIGWNPLESQYLSGNAGGNICGSVAEQEGPRLAVVEGYGSSDVAFVLVDVTDAAAPEVLGELVLPTVSMYDVDITPDTRFVVLATSGPKAPQKVPDPGQAPVGLWRSSCVSGGQVEVPLGVGGEPDLVPYPPGVLLVNIENPAAPFVEDFYVMPAMGAHSVHAAQVDDETIILASVVNMVSAVSPFYFLGIQQTAAGNRLAFLSLYADPPTAGGAPLVNGHNDGWIAKHPATEQTLAYLANWDQGLSIVDISDPRNPVPQGRWSDTPVGARPLADATGQIHEALPLSELVDGRHFTVIGQEILGRPADRPSGYVHVIDTTDPLLPTLAASWTLPVEVSWGGSLQFSTHYLTVVGSTAFVSLYHGGVWAIDLSMLGVVDGLLPSIGAFVPANVPERPSPYQSGFAWTPTVLEVNSFANGDLVVWDARSGVYVVAFDADHPAPARSWSPTP